MTTDQIIINGFAHLHGRLQALWSMCPKEPFGMDIALEEAVDELDELRNDVYKALRIEYGAVMPRGIENE